MRFLAEQRREVVGVAAGSDCVQVLCKGGALLRTALEPFLQTLLPALLLAPRSAHSFVQAVLPHGQHAGLQPRGLSAVDYKLRLVVVLATCRGTALNLSQSCHCGGQVLHTGLCARG